MPRLPTPRPIPIWLTGRLALLEAPASRPRRMNVDHRQPPPHPRNEFFFQDGPYHGHDAWWAAPLHALFVLLLVALLVVGVIWLVRRLSPAASAAAAPAATPAVVGGPAASDPAVATLRMR